MGLLNLLVATFPHMEVAVSRSLGALSSLQVSGRASGPLSVGEVYCLPDLSPFKETQISSPLNMEVLKIPK